MARYAEIKDTFITNVLIADKEFIEQHKPNAIECPEWVGVGDKYEDGEFSRVVVEIVDELEA